MIKNERNLYHFDAIHLLLKVLYDLFIEPNTLKKFKRFWCINVKILFLSSYRYWWIFLWEELLHPCQITQSTQKWNLLNFQEYYSLHLDLLVLNSWWWNIIRIGKLRISESFLMMFYEHVLYGTFDFFIHVFWVWCSNLE